MSIYSASLKTVSRSAGRSATAAAAYRLGEVIEDERTGERHDYTRRGGVEGTFAFAPAGTAPLPANKLWNAAEAAETRKNSTVARELLIALPHDLDPAQRESLTRKIAAQVADRYGVAGSVGIHAPDAEGDQRNLHAHILFTTRSVDQDGKLGAKTRVLDDKKTGPAETIWIRKMVEQETNAALEAAGVESRVDCRSLKDQRAAALAAGERDKAQELDREPTIHLGPRVTQIMREASREGRDPLGVLDRAAANDDLNFDIDAGKAELAEVISMIAFAEKRAAEHEAARIKEDHLRGLRKDLSEAKSELHSAEKEKCEIGEKYSNGKPFYFVAEVRQMRKEKNTAKEAAKAWRDQNPMFAKFADLIGIRLETDRAAQYLTAKYDNAPELKNERDWTKTYKADMSRRDELSETILSAEAKVDRLESEIKALSTPDPEVVQAIKDEVAHGIESARSEIAAFVDKYRPQIVAAAEISSGVDAWISTEIISTGNPIIDELSRKASQFRSRMLSEEKSRAAQNERLMADAVRKAQVAFRKAFDGAFRSAAHDAEPMIDHAAEARRLAAEAAAKALRAPEKAAGHVRDDEPGLG